MNKILTLLSAVAVGAGSLFAQAEPVLPSTAVITPVAESEDEALFLNSVDSKIIVTFDVQPSVPVTVMYVTGNGFGIDMKYERMDAVDKILTIDLKKENWGVPYFENFYLNLGITFSYGDGDDIEYYLNEDGEPVIFQASYWTMDESPASFVRSFPTGEWEKYYTFADAYDEGIATLYFTKEVVHEASIGTITYYLKDGDSLDVEITDVVSDWSDWDGLYTITFPLSMAGLKASEVEAIEANFFGISNSEGEIEVPFMELENTTLVAPKQMQRKSKSLSLINGSDTNDVYTLQGIQIMKSVSVQEINNLPAGIYIINGKKVSVR